MWTTERHHLATASLLGVQHRVRPTLLYPLWQGVSFILGAGTGLMGREAAMACTEAVETVIGEHYDEYVRPSLPRFPLIYLFLALPDLSRGVLTMNAVVS